MSFDKYLTGRREKRLPIMVAVRISALVAQTGEVDQVEVAPVDEGPPILGEVVYCEKFDKARFFVGLKFHSGRAPPGTSCGGTTTTNAALRPPRYPCQLTLKNSAGCFPFSPLSAL